MIKMTCGIGPDLVGELEEHLCEWDASPWALLLNRFTNKGTLEGYFSDQQAATTAWGELQLVFADLPMRPEVSQLEDRDWQEAYKEHFHPWQAGILHIVPTWCKESHFVPDGDKALYLDPGMAFGTGNHETTRLCITALTEFLSERVDDPTNLSCVDAGCGSGILALSAKLLGFGQVQGLDLDPDAIRIAKENAAANALSVLPDFICADLANGIPADSADLLLANIQADVLCENCTALLAALRPGGTLCLSGVLAKEAREVEKVFVGQSDSLDTSVHAALRIDGEWASITLSGNC